MGSKKSSFLNFQILIYRRQSKNITPTIAAGIDIAVKASP
jgi:hypothetical protein